MVGLEKMRRAMRLPLELQDFIPGTEDQSRHLISRIGAMAGAYVTMWLEIEGVPHDPTIVRVYDQGWSNDDSRQHLIAYVSAHADRADPFAQAVNRAACRGEVVTRTRRQMVEDKIWYRSTQIEQYRRPAGLDDCIYSIFVGPRTTRCLSIHRPWNQRGFTEDERALVHALHTECSPLLENADVTMIGTLNRRLRQTLDGLLRGMSEKQLASELALSQHTLHGYVKTLYRRLGVSSRGELHARFDRPARSRSNAECIPLNRGIVTAANLRDNRRRI